MINYRNKCILICSLAFLVLAAVNACKKYENPPQVFEEYGNGLDATASRKVLIINVAGLSGADLLKINPANAAALIKTGKYSYNVLPEAVSTTPATMASMVTGVSSVKHGIIDNSYLQTHNGDDEHGAIIKYPTFFSRLLDVRPEFKTVSITTDASLNNYLIHVDHRILPSTDALVKDSTVNILKSNSARIVMADFRDVDLAGRVSGYSADLPEYKAAVQKIDGYVGELMTALKSRKNFSTEDWLIVLTSNRGSSEVKPTPGFIICSNPNLKQGEVSKSGFNTMHFKGAVTAGSAMNDNGLYDAGANKDFTVQLQVKFNNTSYWPGFFSKSTDVIGHANTGWTMIFNGGNWEVVVGGKNNGGSSYRIGGPTIADGKWHTLSFTVKTIGSVKTATIYTDGVYSNSGDISGSKNLTTTEPLKLGYRNQDNSGTNLDFYAADAEYFNVALDEATIKNNIALQDITKHPNYNNLTGYWRIDEGGGSILYNTAPTGYNLTMAGSPVWDALVNDIPVSRSPTVIKDGTISIVNTVPDVAALTFYWLKVPIVSTWGLDGVPWISNFELEFIK